MNENAYMIIWEAGEGDLSSCVASGFTIGEVDEKFALTYPETQVCAIELIGDYVSFEEEGSSIDS